jgi:hypothetical protein
MILAAGFAIVLFVGMILADWLVFTRLTAAASTYGCGIGGGEDQWPLTPWSKLHERFDRNGLLRLPHGVAKLFHEERRILLRAHAHRFRTAWPLNGSIDLYPNERAIRLRWVKRVPWSSAILTLLWFTVVGGGTCVFAIVLAFNGGLSTLGGILMTAGIAGLGLLVFAFGLITVSLAYRLENHRLLQAYEELRAALVTV